MKCTRRVWLVGIWWPAVLGVGLAGCISAGPPAPPVRWFDPMPEVGDADHTGAVGAAPGPLLRVDAPAHYGREFRIRIGSHEVVFDAEHSWVAAPAELVAEALARRLGRGGAVEARSVRVHVDAFELDLREEPRAHVRLVVSGVAGHQGFDASVLAASRTPESLAAAMGLALAEVAERVAAAGVTSTSSER